MARRARSEALQAAGAAREARSLDGPIGLRLQVETLCPDHLLAPPARHIPVLVGFGVVPPEVDPSGLEVFPLGGKSPPFFSKEDFPLRKALRARNFEGPRLRAIGHAGARNPARGWGAQGTEGARNGSSKAPSRDTSPARPPPSPVGRSCLPSIFLNSRPPEGSGFLTRICAARARDVPYTAPIEDRERLDEVRSSGGHSMSDEDECFRSGSLRRSRC